MLIFSSVIRYSTSVGGRTAKLGNNKHKMSAAPVPMMPIVMDDPSEYRPETRNKDEFRDFRMHTVPERVINVYKAMHKNQTYEFAKGKLEEWGQLNHAEMTIMEALDALNNFVDECDPDVDVPNAVHAFQTAEGNVWLLYNVKNIHLPFMFVGNL